MRETIEEALQICLERIRNGEATIEGCILAYPQYQTELREMLPLALSVGSLGQVKPSQAFSKNAGIRLASKLSEPPVTFWEKLRRNLMRNPNVSNRRYRMSQTIAAMVIAISLLFSGPLNVKASGPGDWLYGLERKVEQIRLRFNTDPEKGIILRLRFATERLEEAQLRINQGKMEHALMALRAYDETMAETARLIDQLPLQTRETLRTRTQETIALQTRLLERIRQSWPDDDQARNAYQQALQNTYMKGEQLFGQPEQAPLGPNEQAPLGPKEEAPLGPNEQAPLGPNEEAPLGPNEEAPQGPSEQEPQEPSEQAPQGPSDQAPQGPSDQAPQGPSGQTPQGPNKPTP